MKRKSLPLLLALLCATSMTAQFNPVSGCITDRNGDCFKDFNLTAMPFLRYAPDARGNALGEAGIARSPDVYSMFYNPSNLAFVENDVSIGFSFNTWNIYWPNEVTMTNLAGHKRINDKSTLGINVKYFSMQLDQHFGDNNKYSAEIELAVAYAGQLTDNLSIGISGKYLYSRPSSENDLIHGILYISDWALATDFSLSYREETTVLGFNLNYAFGMNISNIGNKVSYNDNDLREFIPANLGIGSSANLKINDKSEISVLLDLNKLLTPSPVPRMIRDGNKEILNPDYEEYRTKSVARGISESFIDSGGFSEELDEIALSTGIEYTYDRKFVLRTGYYYQNPAEFDRQNIVVGFGLIYKYLDFDVSYSLPVFNNNSFPNNILTIGSTWKFKKRKTQSTKGL